MVEKPIYHFLPLVVFGAADVHILMLSLTPVLITKTLSSSYMLLKQHNNKQFKIQKIAMMIVFDAFDDTKSLYIKA